MLALFEVVYCWLELWPENETCEVIFSTPIDERVMTIDVCTAHSLLL